MSNGSQGAQGAQGAVGTDQQTLAGILGLGTSTSGIPIKKVLYPPAATIIANFKAANPTASPALLTAITQMAGRFGGQPIMGKSGDSLSTRTVYNLSDQVAADGGTFGPQWWQATLGSIRGVDATTWFSGTKGQRSLASGLVGALTAGVQNYGGDFSKLPTTQNWGTGITPTQAAKLTPDQKTIEVAGQMVQAWANQNATATAKTGALGTITNRLDQWNLSSLDSQVQKWILQDNITDGNQLMDLVRQTPQYKQAFPGIEEQRKVAAQTNTTPLTEQKYLDTVASYQATAQNAGLPSGFLTNQEISKLIAGNVSAQEFNRRVASGYQAVAGLPDAVKQQFMDTHGVGHGGLLAYFLDPTKGEAAIERQALSANLQNMAKNYGVNSFSEQQANDLAEMVRMAGAGAGSGALQDPYLNPLQKAQSALQFAGQQQPITGATPDRGPSVDTNTLIGSQIAGYGGTTQTAAQQQVTRAQQEAMAPMQKGGGFEESAKGVTGIGAAKD